MSNFVSIACNVPCLLFEFLGSRYKARLRKLQGSQRVSLEWDASYAGIMTETERP
jgi:hypothetical protein